MRSFIICTLHGILLGRDQMERMKWAGRVARMGDSRNTHRIIAGRERFGPLGRYRCRWGDNIKMELKGIRCENIDWLSIWPSGGLLRTR